MRATIAAIASVLLFGCPSSDDDEGGGTTSGTTVTTSATTTMTTSSTDATITTTEVGSSSEAGSSSTTTAESSSGGASEGSSGAPAESSTGAPGECTPGPDDDDCRVCVQMHCCSAWTACRNDEGCACTVDCHLAGGALNSCENMCNDDGELYEALFFCGQMSCLGTCEWDCC